MSDYIAEFVTSVAGIPCKIGVLAFEHQQSSFSRHAASDIDYYGETESDWHVLDRTGKRAPWLERKLTPSDVERIEQTIYEKMIEENQND